ncbi:MAG: hypothetical protein JWQ49_3704 [Edaphobacter sp.]|nr:hypothetical protein [Edaphobacter sp.]
MDSTLVFSSHCIAQASLTRSSEFKTYAETASISDTFNVLVNASFLTTDEKLAYERAYGFLCGGSHRGRSEEEDAHLAKILCLTLGQAVLLSSSDGQITVAKASEGVQRPLSLPDRPAHITFCSLPGTA